MGTPTMDNSLFGVLKREMQRRQWNVSRLAEACGADVALTSRWVAENPGRRVVPGPRSCQKIAEALGLDPDYVLELAGHRQPHEARAETDDIERDIRARTVELLAAVRGAPSVFWPAIIRAQLDRAIDGARDMVDLLQSAGEDAPSEHRASDGPEHRARRRARISGSSRGQREIKPRHPAVALAA